MKFSRLTRCMTVLVALLSLLFTQMAVAAYACPQQAQAVAMRDAAGLPMVDCTGMDKQSPSLCHAHSQGEKQALDKGATPSVQPFAAAGFVVALPAADRPMPADFAVPAGFLMAASTAPPIAIRHCCFRL